MTTKKYNDEQLREAVATSISVQEVMRKLGIKMAGGSHYHISNRIKREGLDTSHFMRQAHNKGKPSPKRLLPEQIFRILPDGSNRPKANQLRRALLESGVDYKCGNCGIDKWMKEEIRLEIDHINGNWLDNSKDNLRFLCPNCHSQTQNFSRARVA